MCLENTCTCSCFFSNPCLPPTLKLNVANEKKKEGTNLLYSGHIHDHSAFEHLGQACFDCKGCNLVSSIVSIGRGRRVIVRHALRGATTQKSTRKFEVPKVGMRGIALLPFPQFVGLVVWYQSIILPMTSTVL